VLRRPRTTGLTIEEHGVEFVPDWTAVLARDVVVTRKRALVSKALFERIAIAAMVSFIAARPIWETPRCIPAAWLRRRPLSTWNALIRVLKIESVTNLAAALARDRIVGAGRALVIHALGGIPLASVLSLRAAAVRLDAARVNAHR
jgi:hypothetical protein